MKNTILSGKILSSNSVEAEESDFLVRDAVSFDENPPDVSKYRKTFIFRSHIV
jgi:hypothetical protein